MNNFVISEFNVTEHAVNPSNADNSVNEYNESIFGFDKVISKVLLV